MRRCPADPLTEHRAQSWHSADARDAVGITRSVIRTEEAEGDGRKARTQRTGRAVSARGAHTPVAQPAHSRGPPWQTPTRASPAVPGSAAPRPASAGRISDPGESLRRRPGTRKAAQSRPGPAPSLSLPRPRSLPAPTRPSGLALLPEATGAPAAHQTR